MSLRDYMELEERRRQLVKALDHMKEAEAQAVLVELSPAMRSAGLGVAAELTREAMSAAVEETRSMLAALRVALERKRLELAATPDREATPRDIANLGLMLLRGDPGPFAQDDVYP